MQANQCFFTMVCTVRDGKFGVTDVKGGNWSTERHCDHFVNSLRVCSLDHSFAVLQTSGMAPWVLALCDKAEQLGRMPCQSVSAVLWSLCCLGDCCSALLCKSHHLAEAYRVCWAHLCGILCDCAKELQSLAEGPGLPNLVKAQANTDMQFLIMAHYGASNICLQKEMLMAFKSHWKSQSQLLRHWDTWRNVPITAASSGGSDTDCVALLFHRVLVPLPEAGQGGSEEETLIINMAETCKKFPHFCLVSCFWL